MNGTDADLISHYASTRDAECFAELVSRYRDMVYSAAVRVVREPATAEDVTQDCFLQLARSAASIKSSVAAWLHSVAINASIDVLQQERSRRRREQQVADMATDGSDEATWDEIKHEVHQAIELLPETLREPLVLHFLGGKGQSEVASELGVNQGTVSRRLKRGVAELRERLKQTGVVVSVSGLAACLTTQTAEAAPAALVAALGKIALAGIPSTAPSTGLIASTAAIGLKAKVACVVTATVVGGVGVHQVVSSAARNRSDETRPAVTHQLPVPGAVEAAAEAPRRTEPADITPLPEAAGTDEAPASPPRPRRAPITARPEADPPDAASSSESPDSVSGEQWLSQHITWNPATGTLADLLPALARTAGARVVAPLPGEGNGGVTLGRLAGSRGELLRKIADAANWDMAVRDDLVSFTPEEGIPGAVVGMTTAMRATSKERLLGLLEVLDEDQLAAFRVGSLLAVADFTKEQQDTVLAWVRDRSRNRESGRVIAANLGSTTLHIGLYPTVRVAPEGSPDETLRITIGVRNEMVGVRYFDPATGTIPRRDAGARLGIPAGGTAATRPAMKGQLPPPALDRNLLPAAAAALHETLELEHEVLSVGEVVQAAATAGRREITVDRRYAPMRCFVSTGAYEIRDILLALCWAFGLECREVGPILHLGPAQLQGLARVLERRNVALLKRIHQLLGVTPSDAPVQPEASVLTADLFEDPGTRRRLSELTPEQEVFIAERLPTETLLLLGNAEVAFLLGVRVVVDPHVEREVESASTVTDERGVTIHLKRTLRYQLSLSTF